MVTPPLAGEILELWFGPALESAQAAITRSKAWFSYDPQFDAEIASRFGSLPQRAADGELDSWMGFSDAALARVIILDQFPRNLYRDSARAFAFDAAALQAAISAIDAGLDARLHPLQAVFMFLPFEHAENLKMQERSVELFEYLLTHAPQGCEALFAGYADYARRHRDVVARFGRFPHRNALIGRASTTDEIEYLASGGERFGPKRR